MLAKRQAPLQVEGEAIGAGFAAGERRGAGVAAALEEARDALVRVPLHDDVARDVGEQQGLACCASHSGPSDQSQVVGDLFDLRAGGDQRIEALVERLERRNSRRRGRLRGVGSQNEASPRARPIASARMIGRWLARCSDPLREDARPMR